MKIALLTAQPNTCKGYKFNFKEKRPPNGIGFLYKILKNNKLDVDIYDRYAGNMNWPSDDFKSYDFVGIYCCTLCTEDIFDIIKKLKCKKIAVGGPHAYIYPETFPDKVDYIVRGEGESIIVDLVSGKIKDRIINTKRLTSNELDAIPRFPYEYFWNKGKRKYYDWDFHFSSTKPIFTLNTSRGCPFSCSFCEVRRIWGRNITYMSVDRIINDINYVVSLGAKGIWFREDNFTVNNKRLESLCNVILNNNIKIEWGCETRVDTVDDRLMELMERAGCRGFYIGVEHLSQRMLDIFNKGTTVGQIIKFFKSAHKYHISTAASMIVDHPKETKKDIIEREKYLKIIKPTKIWRNKFRKLF